jgi:hypothetical protein
MNIHRIVLEHTAQRFATYPWEVQQSLCEGPDALRRRKYHPDLHVGGSAERYALSGWDCLRSSTRHVGRIFSTLSEACPQVKATQSSLSEALSDR